MDVVTAKDLVQVTFADPVRSGSEYALADPRGAGARLGHQEP